MMKRIFVIFQVVWYERLRVGRMKNNYLCNYYITYLYYLLLIEIDGKIDFSFIKVVEKMNPSTKGRMQFCRPGERASPSTLLPPSYQTKEFHFSLYLSIHSPLPPSNQTYP